MEKVSDIYDDILTLEGYLMERFQKYSMPYKDYRPVRYLEKLVNAQHYGLPTRLLDWSTNPLKALFFSVENPNFDSVDGIVYGIDPISWWEEVQLVQLDSSLQIFFPEILNERLSAQEGCFTAFPLPTKGAKVLPLSRDNYLDDINDIYSVQIEAKYKKQMRVELNQLGINHRTSFPGLDGIANWIKSELSGFAA